MWITSVNKKQRRRIWFLPICRADERTANYCGALIATVKQIRRESRKRNYAELKPDIFDQGPYVPPTTPARTAKVKAFLLSNRQPTFRRNPQPWRWRQYVSPKRVVVLVLASCRIVPSTYGSTCRQNPEEYHHLTACSQIRNTWMNHCHTRLIAHADR
jgi:hypothetical protein